ncbi:ComEC/Rec2 family competence protein [Sanguibacter sp. 25GB23B1]|uniref:ComEC/Rec2 family competence protein n=1 Tax=unclassified Sanguibacter TaxID=2645534 RepID=UPI0032AF4114
MAPLDLRLVPAAAACWLTALVLVAETPERGARTAALAAAVAVVALVAAARVAQRPSQEVALGALSAPRRVLRLLTTGVGQILLVSLVVACTAGAVAGQGGVRERGEMSSLVREGAEVHVTGRVVTSAVPVAGGVGGRTRLDLAATAVEWSTPDGPVRGSAHVTLLVLGGAELLDAAYGSVVTVRGTLRALEPGDSRTAMLMVARGDPDDDAAVVRLDEPPGATTRAVNAVRSDFMSVSRDLPAQARGLVPGVGIGDTSMLAPALDEALVVTSLTHITAVSGSHFAIIAATVAGLCSLLRVPRWGRVGVAGTVMTGFVLLVHPEPSVLRAGVMCAVALLAVLLGRPSQAVAALSVTAMVLLLVDPWFARSYGFALSVLATAGLVVGTAPITRLLARLVPSWLALAVAVPVAAQLACAPVIVLLDPSVSLYAVPANLLAAPALVPATILSVVSALLSSWWPAGALAVAQVAGWSTWWIAEVAEAFAAAPLARVPWMPGAGGAWLLAGLTAVLVLLCATRRSLLWWARTRLFVLGWAPSPSRPARGLSRLLDDGRVSRAVDAVAGPAAAALAPARRAARPLAPLLAALGVGAVLLVVVALIRPPWVGMLAGGPGPGPAGWPPDWEVAQCDVGQGDALVVRTATGHGLMVDVGPEGGGAGACLSELGIDHLDLLVLTHFHADHVGGLEDVLGAASVAEVLVSPVLDPVNQATAVLDMLAEADVLVTTAPSTAAGTVAGDAEVAWRVLAPVADPAAGTVSALGAEGGANDGSVALEIRTQNLTVVALGDLERDGQAAVLRRLREEGEGEVDVVKMAHHGSAVQDPALAELLSPRVTFVSAGAGNTYGHPAPEAVSLYRAAGSAILRTDECGTVGVLERDGELLVVGDCR